jgi:hypothetical protein
VEVGTSSRRGKTRKVKNANSKKGTAEAISGRAKTKQYARTKGEMVPLNWTKIRVR